MKMARSCDEGAIKSADASTKGRRSVKRRRAGVIARLTRATEIVQRRFLEAVRAVEQFFPYLAALASLVAILSAILRWGRPLRRVLRWLRVHSAHYQVRQLLHQVSSLERRLDTVQMDIKRVQSHVAALEAILGSQRRESHPFSHGQKE